MRPEDDLGSLVILQGSLGPRHEIAGLVTPIGIRKPIEVSLARLDRGGIVFRVIVRDRREVSGVVVPGGLFEVSQSSHKIPGLQGLIASSMGAAVAGPSPRETKFFSLRPGQAAPTLRG